MGDGNLGGIAGTAHLDCNRIYLTGMVTFEGYIDVDETESNVYFGNEVEEISAEPIQGFEETIN